MRLKKYITFNASPFIFQYLKPGNIQPTPHVPYIQIIMDVVDRILRESQPYTMKYVLPEYYITDDEGNRRFVKISYADQGKVLLAR